MMRKSTRRNLLGKSFTTGVAAVALGTAPRARAGAKKAGGGETIRLGIIGCGGRSTWLLVNRFFPRHNLAIVAAADIWNQKREHLAKVVADKFGQAPKLYRDYRKLLDDADIDAVLIGTADHQHCGMLIDAVQAGKDVYCEKPIAMELDELNKAYDVVKGSGRVVQLGTQGRSCRGAASARDFIQAGKLGKVLRAEESRSHYIPYWNHYKGPASPSDTDWKAFLYNRPYRPYDADQHGAWMGYRDFSSGPVGGWMSHFSDLLHYVTGADFPVTAVSQGGIYAPTSDPRRTCPDTVTAILEYPEGFTTSFTTHFGNAANDYRYIFGSKGTMRMAAPDGWPNGIMPVVSGEGSEAPDRIEAEQALPNTHEETHVENWLRCIRQRQQPNANIEAGYRHGVAVILADQAFARGRKMRFDAKARQITPA